MNPIGGAEVRIFLVAGEHSGDALGAGLMRRLREMTGGRVTFQGVGGDLMEAQGLASLFPLSDVAVMGPAAIIPKLPTILRRVYGTVGAAVRAAPHALVIIDSPEFTHPIAKRFRRRLPDVPIVDYVSPSVWAWRPGRAARMRGYVDHVLALLPFEPDVHRRLGGPPCSYVGHPLIEKQPWIAALEAEPLARRLGLDRARPILVILPGSRRSEVRLLMQPFGEAIATLAAKGPAPQVLLPVVESVRHLVEPAVQSWSVKPHLVEGEADKFAAFKLADAALAASGTVTLELALAGTPMVVAYKVDGFARHLRFLVKAPSIVLANLVLGENVFPELIQEECAGEPLAAALRDVVSPGPVRERQLAGLARIPERMLLPRGTPSEAAAGIVLDLARQGRV